MLLSQLFGLPTGFAHTWRIGYNIRLLFRGHVVHIVVVEVVAAVDHILFVVLVVASIVVGRLIWFAISFVVPASVIVFVIVITIFIRVSHIVVAVAVATNVAAARVAILRAAFTFQYPFDGNEFILDLYLM